MSTSEEDSVNKGTVVAIKLHLSRRTKAKNHYNIFITLKEENSKKENKIPLEFGSDGNFTNNKLLLDYCVQKFPQLFTNGNDCKIVKLLVKKYDSNKHIFAGNSEVAQVILEHNTNSPHMKTDHYSILNAVIEKKYTVILAMQLKIVDKNGQTLGHFLFYLTDKNKSVFHYAVLQYAMRGEETFLQILLKYQFDINIKDGDGLTVLHFAVFAESLNAIKVLTKNGADHNIQDAEDCTALHIAIIMKQTDIAKVLLNSNVDLNLKNIHGQTPLHCAVESHNLIITQCLLEKNVDINIKDEDGRTPLHLANADNNHNLVEILLKHNALVNVKDGNGLTPLHLAVKSWTIDTSCIECVNMLTKHNADVNAVDNNNRIPLHYASAAKYPGSVVHLLEHGSKVDIKDKDGRTPLHFACQIDITKERGLLVECLMQKYTLTTINLLLKNGAKVNCKDKDGKTPLHCAAKNNDEKMHECHQFLLDAGADINVLDNSKCTAVNYGIIKPLTEHVIKMHLAKLYVCQKNVDLLYKTNKKRPKWIADFENVCNEEIAKLKCEIHNSGRTYYQFLLKDIQGRANFLKDENIVKTLEAGTWKEKFPLYHNILKIRFQEAQIRSKLLEPALKYTTSEVFKKLPIICINNILNFLNNNELEIFIEILKHSVPN